MRVLVTGGRDHTSHEDRMWLYAGLNLLHDKVGITEIIEGGARGFDAHAHNWVLWREACGDTIEHTQVLPDWERYSKGLKLGQKNPAAVIRNREMADLKPDLVLVCPGGDGTADMMRVAQQRRIQVVLLEKMPVKRATPLRAALP